MRSRRGTETVCFWGVSLLRSFLAPLLVFSLSLCSHWRMLYFARSHSENGKREPSYFASLCVLAFPSVSLKRGIKKKEPIRRSRGYRPFSKVHTQKVGAPFFVADSWYVIRNANNTCKKNRKTLSTRSSPAVPPLLVLSPFLLAQVNLLLLYVAMI